MVPALRSGDSVSVHAADFAEIRPGELVVFVRNHHFVVHRFVRYASGIGGAAIVTRGDACVHDDAPVPRDEFLGVVARVDRIRARTWAPAALGRLARLIWRPGLVHGLARRALASLARGIAGTRALQNAP